MNKNEKNRGDKDSKQQNKTNKAPDTNEDDNSSDEGAFQLVALAQILVYLTGHMTLMLKSKILFQEIHSRFVM